MKCPLCEKTLQRVTYENVPVMQCPSCSGYLVARNRLTLIRGSRDQDSEALREEAERQGARDTSEPVKCPRCRVDRMKKQKVRIDGEDAFTLDVCPRCDHTWLDGGELARLQMKFEASAQAIESFARQDRLEGMSEEERGALDRDITKLSSDDAPLSGGFENILLACGVFVAAILTLIFHFGYQSAMGAGVLSLLLTVVLIWLFAQRIDASSTTRLVLSLVVGAAEVAYLVYLGIFFV